MERWPLLPTNDYLNKPVKNRLKRVFSRELFFSPDSIGSDRLTNCPDATADAADADHNNGSDSKRMHPANHHHGQP